MLIFTEETSERINFNAVQFINISEIEYLITHLRHDISFTRRGRGLTAVGARITVDKPISGYQLVFRETNNPIN